MRPGISIESFRPYAISQISCRHVQIQGGGEIDATFEGTGSDKEFESLHLSVYWSVLFKDLSCASHCTKTAVQSGIRHSFYFQVADTLVGVDGGQCIKRQCAMIQGSLEFRERLLHPALTGEVSKDCEGQ